MGILDLILLIFVGFLALLGLRSGLIHESVTLLGLAVGLAVAGQFNEIFGVLLLPWLHTRGMANLGAFLLLLFGAWAATLVVGTIMREMLRGIRLGWLDNIGGLLFGTAKGLFMAEIIVLILMTMPDESLRGAVKSSWLGSRMAALAPDLLELIPPVLRYWNPF